MTAQKRGLQYEKELAADLHHHTNTMIVFGGGTSGNVRIPQPDLLIVDTDLLFAIEIKKTSKDRFYIQSDDIDQLINSIPYTLDDQVIPLLLVKFNHREPVIIDLLPFPAVPDQFNEHWTKESSLRLDKPSTDEWPSSRSGREDWKVVADDLALTV